MKDLKCPYCDEDLEVCHDDGAGYDEDVLHEMQCGHCDKNFVFETHISFHYFASKADCLNGSDHAYALTNTFPKEFSRMLCSSCGDVRSLTDAERSEFGIGSTEDYFKSLRSSDTLK